MDTDSPPFKIGDSVKVKPEVLDPDTEAFSIGGWQGRIIEIREHDDGTIILDIEWDSITLRKMPKQSIETCEEEGLDWTQMGLYPENIELTTARDTATDVQHIQEELEDAHYHSYRWLGEEGKRIQKILTGVHHDNEMEVMEKWGEYLGHHLSFPFEAVVDEWHQRGPLRTGDRVNVKKISLVDDFYGLIVEVRLGRKKYDCPLCELAATDKQSSNNQLINDYRVWFANR
jgi:hypothetical protein